MTSFEMFERVDNLESQVSALQAKVDELQKDARVLQMNAPSPKAEEPFVASVNDTCLARFVEYGADKLGAQEMARELLQLRKLIVDYIRAEDSHAVDGALTELEARAKIYRGMA